MNLDAKVALVTGAAGMNGMGRAISLRLAREGADVVVVDHPQAAQNFPPDVKQAGWKGLHSVVQEIQELGRRSLAINGDITSSSDVETIISRTLKEFGRIDILVNNAGIVGPKGVPVVELSRDDWEPVLRVNVIAPFMLSQLVARDMIRRREGGRIVMISSYAGKGGLPGAAIYCASKAALISLTQTLAHELAQYKINVNAICPGVVSTDMNYARIERFAKEKGISIEHAREQWTPEYVNIPLGRSERPEDVANAVAFLATSDSDYITGQAINVCGGIMLAR